MLILVLLTRPLMLPCSPVTQLDKLPSKQPALSNSSAETFLLYHSLPIFPLENISPAAETWNELPIVKIAAPLASNLNTPQARAIRHRKIRISR